MKTIARCLQSVIIATGMLVTSAQAAIISGPSFGTAPAGFDSSTITFGGSGIPNNLLTYFTAEVGNDTILFALTAHQRFSSPTVTTDGEGNYFAAAGNCTGSNCATQPRAAWNFAWFVGSQQGANLFDLGLTSLSLRYDVDPSTGTDFGVLGLLPLFDGAPSQQPPQFFGSQSSQNLTFGFLFDSNVVDAPSGSFDLNLDGEYRFVLEAGFDNGATGSAAINVIVGNGAVEVPAPAPLALLGLGLIGIALRRRQA